MALKANSKPKASVPEEESKVVEEPSAPEPAVEEQTEAGRLVKVYNPQIWGYVQPGSGIKIPAKSFAELRDDGWLFNQLRAGVLQKDK